MFGFASLHNVFTEFITFQKKPFTHIAMGKKVLSLHVSIDSDHDKRH